MTGTAPALRQSANAVLMVRPVSFYGNPETAPDNRFQQATVLPAADLLARAQAEWDGLAAALDRVGVRVCAAEARVQDDAPDALYPNNWLTTHADGRCVLYPMLAPSRRRERRADLLRALAAHFGFAVGELIDLSRLEYEQRFLEGTGSLVIDRPRAAVYACRSLRCHPDALASVAARFGWAVHAFDALDPAGHPVYHTNVMLSLGTGFAVICAESIADRRQRQQTLAALEASGRAIIEIRFGQMQQFAANVLEVEGRGGEHYLALSRRALTALDATQRRHLERYVGLVDVDVSVIETTGGGGVRCMLAEIFLPTASSPP